MNIGIRLGGKESKITGVWEWGGGVLWVIFGREMSMHKIVYKATFRDLCSSLNVTGMIRSKRTKRGLVWSVHEEEEKYSQRFYQETPK